MTCVAGSPGTSSWAPPCRSNTHSGEWRLSVRRRDAAEATTLLEAYRSNVTQSPARAESPEERVARALRAAVVAFGLCPVLLHAFSLSLLLGTRYESLGNPGRQRYWLALSINLTVLLASAVLLGLSLG